WCSASPMRSRRCYRSSASMSRRSCSTASRTSSRSSSSPAWSGGSVGRPRPASRTTRADHVSAGYPERSGRAAALPPYSEAPATPRSAPVGTREHPLPLIIDSDPGLADALAIGLGLARTERDILGVTTVGGNADVGHCTENALRLLHAYGRDDIPVAEGAAGPLVGRVVRATEVHGEAGIGSSALPTASRVRHGEHCCTV